jgi:hypothetical protein
MHQGEEKIELDIISIRGMMKNPFKNRPNF